MSEHPQQNSPNTLGAVSLILGVGAILVGCCLGAVSLAKVGTSVTLAGGVAAIVLGLVGKRDADRGEAGRRGVALAGLIAGALAVVLGAIGIIATFVVDAALPFN